MISEQSQTNSIPSMKRYVLNPNLFQLTLEFSF